MFKADFQRSTTLAIISFLVAVGTPHSDASAATISSTGYFTAFDGDVNPVSIPIFETFVNGVQVPQLVPDVVLNGYFQGHLDLPGLTSSVDFKDRQQNFPFNASSVITFTGVNADPLPPTQDAVFKLGTITVTNGVFFSQANFNIVISTQSDDAFFNGRSFSDVLQYTVTPTVGDPIADAAANADRVVFVNHQFLGSISVYEAASGLGNTGSVDLYGRVGSLDPVFFANATGGVFIGPPVPEPSQVMLMLVGLALLGGVAQKRNKILLQA